MGRTAKSASGSAGGGAGKPSKKGKGSAAESAKSGTSAKSVKVDKAGKAPKSAKGAKGAKAPKGGKTAKDAKPAKNAKPATSTKDAKAPTGGKTVEAPKGAKTVKNAKPAKPTKNAKATKSGKLAKKARAAKIESPPTVLAPAPAADPDRVADTPTVASAVPLTRAEVTATTESVRRGAGITDRFSDVLAFTRGDRLVDIDPSGTPGFDGDHEDGAQALAECSQRVGELQERLFAESRAGGRRSVLLVLQGMDTAGKGGIVEHVVGAVGPQGVRLTSFKAPTEEERAHDFLWRITNALPGPGQVAVFDRSHYEDVLIVRVHDLVPAAQWRARYAAINAWERRVAAGGTKIVKCMLHISKDEQKERLTARLADPTKLWKYNPGDVDERGRWADYQSAYQVALSRCSTVTAPWHVVPADHKWYARLAVQQLLLEALTEMAPVWPAPAFDLGVEQARVAES